LRFRIPPFHWWRTVFFLIPAIALYTVVLGTLSIGSSLFEKRGYFAHWCARTWSRLILLTTGVRVRVRGLERLAKESLGSFPFLGWHLRRTGHMLVDRRKPDPHAVFDWASRLTSQGLSLIVFPEGTRSRDGRVGRFKGGSFHLALEAGLPIVPLSVIGSRHVMLKGRLATYPGDVTLVVHDPIDTAGMSGAHAKEFGERVRQIIKPDAESDVANVVPSGA
jgi:1-acyl-sn-glycerol-3-phosphate acyltransferase